MLNNLGYDTGGVDGIFGRKTRSAVKAFQKANGLKADGILGKNTITALTNNKSSGRDIFVDRNRKSIKDLKPVYKDRQPKMPKYKSDVVNEKINVR